MYVQTWTAAQLKSIKMPVEPDLVALETVYNGTYEHLNVLSRFKDDLSMKCSEVAKGLRKFTANLAIVSSCPSCASASNVDACRG